MCVHAPDLHLFTNNIAYIVASIHRLDSSMENCDSTIPVIDFDQLGVHRKYESIDMEALKGVGNLVVNAFSTSGFCYLQNHGISSDLVDKYMTLSKEFFQQSLEEKHKHVRKKKSGNFGWIAMEQEKLNPDRPGDLKESFNYLPADDPNYWPTVDFQQANKEMFERCSELSLRVCDALSAGLGLGETFMRDAHKYMGHKNSQTALRSLYYPPISADSDLKPGQIRLGEHSDYGTITLLFQANIGGLEVNSPGRGYVPVIPIPGTVIVNIGSLLQRWTSDALVAAKHRVLIPDVEFKKRNSRQSVAFFVLPDDNYIIECVDGSRKYDPISSIDYLNYRLSFTY